MSHLRAEYLLKISVLSLMHADGAWFELIKAAFYLMVLHQAVDMIDEWTLLFTMYTTLQTLRGNCKLYGNSRV